MQYRVEGTAAYVPAHVATGRTERRRRRKRSSAPVRRNRIRALKMNAAYVVFLSLVSALTVLMCVYYLELKETASSIAAENQSTETNLMALRSENDALYEMAVNSVDWNRIRETAVGRLGMKYAAEDQIVWYNKQDSYSIRQYRDVDAGS